MQVNNYKPNTGWDAPYKVIGRGKVGWHAQSESCSSSGGTFDGYVSKAEEGALVYDAEDADYGAFVKMTIAGPMLKLSLAAGQVQKFGELEREAMVRMAPGLGGSALTIAAMAVCGLTSLDFVALDIYEGLLRNVPGMKVGHVRDGRVVWEP